MANDKAQKHITDFLRLEQWHREKQTQLVGETEDARGRKGGEYQLTQERVSHGAGGGTLQDAGKGTSDYIGKGRQMTE